MMGNGASVSPAGSIKNGRRPVTSKRTERDESVTQRLKCAVSGMKGWRPTMEDQHMLEFRLNVGAKKQELQCHSIFGVFDGHGGGYTSRYLKDNFVSVFCNRPELEEYAELENSGPESRSDGNGVQLLQDALTATFLKIDEDLMTMHEEKVAAAADAAKPQIIMAKKPTALSAMDRSGSTAVVVLLTPHYIICANAGDSRAVLRRHGRVVPLSFDHKPKNITEQQRVLSAGGFIKKKRVDGDLAVSRAFGDFCMKSNTSLPTMMQKVIVNPDFLVYPRDLSGDEFIILACDGIWDVATNEQCADFVQNLLSAGELDLGNICEEALDTCLEKNSRDNMTMMLVGLPALKADSSSRARLNNALWGHRTTRKCNELTNATDRAASAIATQLRSVGASTSKAAALAF